jgi:alkyl hydroperoxide reductase subunit AhpF
MLATPMHIMRMRSSVEKDHLAFSFDGFISLNCRFIMDDTIAFWLMRLLAPRLKRVEAKCNNYHWEIRLIAICSIDCTYRYTTMP